MENNQRITSNPHLAKPVLCEGFLIPMTDFVLKYYSDETMDELQILDLINNYATFLKQPLKLEMFVPCDDEGNFLNEPNIDHSKYYTIQNNGYLDRVMFNDDVEIYEQAKEKVLFEGFKLYKDYECAKYEDVYVDEEVCDGKFTIEELSEDLGETKIKLSHTALDSIFGKTVA